MKKPTECCAIGTHGCLIPMRGIEYCIVDIVAALNAAHIITEASCCGHEKQLGNVVLEDGRWLLIARDREHFQRIADALANEGIPMGGR